MPNGRHNEPDYAEYFLGLDRFFAPIADHVTSFAATHNLLLEKYYHEAPMWRLCLAHPKGGQATIDLARGEGDQVSISANWWIDDYDSFTRSLRYLAPCMCNTAGPMLMRQLEDYLNLVLSWEPGEWTEVAADYKGIWDRVWTKEQFDKLADRWPAPK